VNAEVPAGRGETNGQGAELWAGDGEFPSQVLAAPHDRMLSQYFDRQALLAIASHERPALPGADREAVEAWQRRVRARLIRDLGLEELPREDLCVRTVRRARYETYALEQLTFESQPGVVVAASLYLPHAATSVRPVPAVLCVHGHGPSYALGRRTAQEQARAIGFARRGYIVLSVDMLGLGERAFMGHDHAMHLPAAGLSLAGLLAWDNVRALDYLAARPEVDASRLGATGTSGGGNQTLYLAAVDERVQAAAPVCSVETYRDYMSKWRCTCETVPNVLRYAEMADVLALAAPRAMLVVSGVRDTGFSIASARETFLSLRAVYEALGVPERAAMAEIYSGHDYNRSMREAVYAWFDRWLMGGGPHPLAPSPTGEGERRPPAAASWGEQLVGGHHGGDGAASAAGPVEREVDPALRALPDGVLPAGALTLADPYSRHSTAQVATVTTRAAVRQTGTGGPEGADWGERRTDFVERVLGGLPARTPLCGERRPLPGGGGEAVVFFPEPEIIVPGLLLPPVSADGRVAAVDAVVIGVHRDGKRALAGRREVAELRAAGAALLLLDYRGVGETRPADAWNPRRSLMLGRHLLGLQAWDLRRAVDWIQQQPDLGGPVALWAEGSAAAVALVAAACDTRFRGAALADLVAGFAGDADGSLVQDQCPWRLFDWGDLPDLAALVAPRDLLLVNPRDGRGQPLDEAGAAARFERTASAFQRAEPAVGGDEPGGAFRFVVDTERPAREHVVPWLRRLAERFDTESAAPGGRSPFPEREGGQGVRSGGGTRSAALEASGTSASQDGTR
jgi:dienelactone hydrolase